MNRIMKAGLCLATAALLVLAGGCANVRSISNSSYPAPEGGGGGPARELSEFDVLGIDASQPVSEEEIAQAGSRAQRVVLKPGSAVLLVQSGAEYPDGPMLTGLSKKFQVVPFTGIPRDTTPRLEPKPWEDTTRNVAVVTDPSGDGVVLPWAREHSGAKPPPEPASYSKLLRLAAARGGADTVICYWGILESAREKFATKSVSWVPVVGWAIPDESEHMRIRVKMAVIDVRTGNWTMLSAAPIEEKAWSTIFRHEAVDQKHVESLKARAYASSVNELVTHFMD